MKEIDYDKMIKDCYDQTKCAQGTSGCVQFARGAVWWREQMKLDEGRVGGALSVEGARADKAEALLRLCLDGFGAYIHGRKLKRQQCDRLREDIQQFLESCNVRTAQSERDVSVADGRDWG